MADDPEGELRRVLTRILGRDAAARSAMAAE